MIDGTFQAGLRNPSMRAAFWVLGVYLIAALVATKLMGDFAPLGILALILLPFLVYIFFADCSFLVLGYLALMPLIQHLSQHGAAVGDFDVTPHMVIQFFVLIAATNSFLFSYDARKNLKLNNLDKTLILFVLLTIFSLIFAYSLPVNHEKRWLLFYTGIFENATFYFVIVYITARDEDMANKILIALAISSFSAAIAAVQELHEVGFNLISIFLARMRIGFGYHNTNLFGIHSAILFPLSFFTLVSPRFRRVRVLAWVGFVILSVLSVLCFNRGTFIVLIIELFLLFFIRENRKIIYGFFVAMISAAVYFSHLLLFYIYRFIGGSNSSGDTSYLDTSAMYRYEAWKVGLKLLYLYPFGVGAGGFQYAWQIYGRYPTLFLGTPHQLFLSIGVDYGVLPMLCFIAMLILAFVYSEKLSKSAALNPHFEMFKYVKISLIGFVIYGTITDGELSHLSGLTLPNNGYTLLLFTLLGIISAYSSKYLVQKAKP